MTNTEAWDYAIGMVKMAGLEPTREFMQFIEKEKQNEISMDDIKQFLDKKYKNRWHIIYSCHLVLIFALYYTFILFHLAQYDVNNVILHFIVLQTYIRCAGCQRLFSPLSLDKTERKSEKVVLIGATRLLFASSSDFFKISSNSVIS